MRVSTLLTVAIALSTLAITAEAKEPTAIASEFFGLVKANKVPAAYDALFIGSSLPKVKPQAIALMKRQTSTALSLYGPIVGVELVKSEKYGNSLVKLVYLLKFNNLPTVWRLYFYKPKDHWFLTNVVFNDRYNLLD